MRRARVFVAAAIGLAGLVCSGGEAAGQGGAAVHGQVLEFGSDVPVAMARVELLDSRLRRVAGSLSDSAGSFRLENVRPGAYSLRAVSIGYREVTTPVISVGSEPVEVILRVAVDAVPLAPLEVVTRPSPLHHNPSIAAFLERARSGMGGTFITRERIEEIRPQRASDLLRMVGSITVVDHGAGHRGVIHNARTQCQPAVYVDRVLVSSRYPSAYEAMNSVNWADLEGIEVYAGPASLPAEFSGSRSGCGVIAMWTRR